MTDVAYSDSFIPLTGDSYGWMVCRHTVIREQPPGSLAVKLMPWTPLLGAMLEFCGADPNVRCQTLGVTFPFGLFAPAMRGDGEGQRTAGVSWGCDER